MRRMVCTTLLLTFEERFLLPSFLLQQRRWCWEKCIEGILLYHSWQCSRPESTVQANRVLENGLGPQPKPPVPSKALVDSIHPLQFPGKFLFGVQTAESAEFNPRSVSLYHFQAGLQALGKSLSFSSTEYPKASHSFGEWTARFLLLPATLMSSEFLLAQSWSQVSWEGSYECMNNHSVNFTPASG